MIFGSRYRYSFETEIPVTLSHHSKSASEEPKKRLLANSIKTICQRIDILPHTAISLFFSVFPTLASGASIARGRPPPTGGAHLAPSLRSRRDKIGQKPEPTYLFFAKMKTDCYAIIQKKRNQKYSSKKGDFYWVDHKQKPLRFGLLPKKN